MARKLAHAHKQAMPHTRIIVILRHPIERAHSRFVEQTFFAKKAKKREINNCPVWMGWDRFVDHATQRITKCFASIPSTGASNDRECIHHNNELGWSIYAPSLLEWITQFGSPSFPPFPACLPVTYNSKCVCTFLPLEIKKVYMQTVL